MTMEVEVKLSRIVINEKSDQQLIILSEKQGSRSLPIVIGIVEIFAIDRRLKGIEPPRPMTHDLLANVIKHLGAVIEKVVIDDVRHHTYFAKIHLMLNDKKKVIVDSRPSDAIALTAGTSVPLFVAEHVLDDAAG